MISPVSHPPLVAQPGFDARRNFRDTSAICAAGRSVSTSVLSTEELQFGIAVSLDTIEVKVL